MSNHHNVHRTFTRDVDDISIKLGGKAGGRERKRKIRPKEKGGRGLPCDGDVFNILLYDMDSYFSLCIGAVVRLPPQVSDKRLSN